MENKTPHNAMLSAGTADETHLIPEQPCQNMSDGVRNASDVIQMKTSDEVLDFPNTKSQLHEMKKQHEQLQSIIARNEVSVQVDDQ